MMQQRHSICQWKTCFELFFSFLLSTELDELEHDSKTSKQSETRDALQQDNAEAEHFTHQQEDAGVVTPEAEEEAPQVL